jgi:hypothetical protein
VKACVMFLFARRVRNSGAYDRSATVGRRGSGKAWPSFVPRGHESPCSPTNSFDSRPTSRPNMLLPVFGVEKLSLLLLRPWNELPRLAAKSRPDLGWGRECGRRLPGRLRLDRGPKRCGRCRGSWLPELVVSAVSPERLVRASEGRRRTSTCRPDAFDRIAGAEPGFDLALMSEEAGVRFVFGRVRRRSVRVDFLDHTPLSVLETQSMFAKRIFFARPVRPELRAAATSCYLLKLGVSA